MRCCSSLCCISIVFCIYYLQLLGEQIPNSKCQLVISEVRKTLFLHAIQQAVASFRQLALFSPSHWFSSDISGTFPYAFKPSGHSLYFKTLHDNESQVINASHLY